MQSSVDRTELSEWMNENKGRMLLLKSNQNGFLGKYMSTVTSLLENSRVANQKTIPNKLTLNMRQQTNQELNNFRSHMLKLRAVRNGSLFSTYSSCRKVSRNVHLNMKCWVENLHFSKINIEGNKDINVIFSFVPLLFTWYYCNTKSTDGEYTLNADSAISQVANRRLLTAETGVRAKVSSYGIFGERSGTRQALSEFFSFAL